MSGLPVAEHFYSIQGEGPYAGHPSVFLRLAGCNLSCGWEGDLQDFDPDEAEPQGDADWVCDTIDVWRDPDRMYEPEELADEWRGREWIHLNNGAHIVLTGGEPTLPAHQERFVEFYRHLREEGLEPFVEVETNGTQLLNPAFRGMVDHFNVSLKLSNSGHTEEERLDPEAILQFTEMGPEKAVFKFVVAEPEDMVEINSIVADYLIPKEQIMLMPAGYSQETLSVTYPLVAEMCKDKGYRFSPRLHVNIWDQATGV